MTLDLSTKSAQAAHYERVNDRLWNGVTPPEKRPRVQPVTQAWPPRPKPKLPGIRRGRDWLMVTDFPDARSIRDWRKIVEEVAEKHNVSINDMLSRRRCTNFVRARQEAAYRLSVETRLSLPQIGQRLGGRDHTTIMHSIRRYKDEHEAEA